jgi:hypothetical protein
MSHTMLYYCYATHVARLRSSETNVHFRTDASEELLVGSS